jgi:hypothetical protein
LIDMIHDGSRETRERHGKIMDLAKKYLLAGLLWGILIGYGAVAIATGLGVAALYFLVYGDGPWGESTGALLYGLAIAGFFGAIVICGGVGYLFGRRMEAVMDAGEQALEHRRALILIGAAVAAAFAGGYQLYAQNAAMTVRQDYLEQLLESRQGVADVRARHRRDGEGIDIAVTTRGARAGTHSLELQVQDAQGRLLEHQRHDLELPDREAYRVYTVAYADLLPRVVPRENRDQDALDHREVLSVIARLVPVLEPRELRTLPRHAAANYLAPDSPFYSEGGVEHPVEFRFEGGRYWVAVEGELQPVRQR